MSPCCSEYSPATSGWRRGWARRDGGRRCFAGLPRGIGQRVLPEVWRMVYADSWTLPAGPDRCWACGAPGAHPIDGGVVAVAENHQAREAYARDVAVVAGTTVTTASTVVKIIVMSTTWNRERSRNPSGSWWVVLIGACDAGPASTSALCFTTLAPWGRPLCIPGVATAAIPHVVARSFAGRARNQRQCGPRGEPSPPVMLAAACYLLTFRAVVGAEGSSRQNTVGGTNRHHPARRRSVASRRFGATRCAPHAGLSAGRSGAVVEHVRRHPLIASVELPRRSAILTASTANGAASPQALRGNGRRAAAARSSRRYSATRSTPGPTNRTAGVAAESEGRGVAARSCAGAPCSNEARDLSA